MNLTTDSMNCLIENNTRWRNKTFFWGEWLLGQNTQDLRKGLDEIKQQTIELNKDERNRTNNKNENDRLNNILSVIDRIY